MPITALPRWTLTVVQRTGNGMQSNYRELITGISLTPSRPTRSVLCLSPTRSFSPIKQYLYANHPGLIATALHAWVIRVTIMVSRSPIVSYSRPRGPTHVVSRALPYVEYNGVLYETRRISDDCTAASLLQNILIIPLSAFLASSETRPAGIIIVIMHLQKLGTRIVRRVTI